MDVLRVLEEVVGRLLDDLGGVKVFGWRLGHPFLQGVDDALLFFMVELVQELVSPLWLASGESCPRSS